jgi:hypothetical protein
MIQVNFKKPLLALLFLACGKMLSAQSLVVLYTFSDYNGGTIFDGSGNNYDATLVGGANIFGAGNGLCQVGMDSTDYLKVPVEVLNGLEDFTIDIKVKVQKLRTKSDEPMNTFFSASRPDCIYCLGLAYEVNSGSWLVTFNGVTHSFAGSFQGFKHALIRKQGLVSLYVILGDELSLIGSFFDDSPMDFTSFLLGQQEHCIEGCFQGNQGLFGAYNNLRIFNEALEKISDEETEVPGFSLSPNPLSSTTILEFNLTQPSPIKLELLDLRGSMITMISDGKFETGTHQLMIERKDLTAGLYLIRFSSSSGTTTHKLIID